MRIQSLSLRNFRCFAELEISFEPDVTVLIAPNGKGKSAVADALAIALGPWVGAFPYSSGRAISRSDMKQQLRIIRWTSEEKGVPAGTSMIDFGDLPVLMYTNAKIGRYPFSWKQELRTPKGRTTTNGAKTVIDRAVEVQNKINEGMENISLPVVAHYGTGRLWGANKITRSTDKFSRYKGYVDCLNFSSNYKDFAAWYADQLYKSYQFSKEQGESADNPYRNSAEAVNGAVTLCLEQTGWRNLDEDSRFSELVMSRGFINTDEVNYGLDRVKTLPVSRLSDGIRTVIGLVGDIARRTCMLNPQFGKSAPGNTPGVVIIDEVDMHLHPEWQQQIIPSLRRTFPEIQFILTTHSPQVLTTVEAQKIRVLDCDEEGIGSAVIPSDQTLAAESGNVLSLVMGVNQRPDLPQTSDINRYVQLVHEGKHDTAEALDLRKNLESLGSAVVGDLQIADIVIKAHEARRAG